MKENVISDFIEKVKKLKKEDVVIVATIKAMTYDMKQKLSNDDRKRYFDNIKDSNILYDITTEWFLSYVEDVETNNYSTLLEFLNDSICEIISDDENIDYFEIVSILINSEVVGII